MLISFTAVICLVAAFTQVNADWQSYPIKGNANHLWQPSYNEIYGDVLRAVYGDNTNGVKTKLYENVANSPLVQSPYGPVQQAQRLPGLTGKIPTIHQMISSSPQLQSLLARYPGAVMQIDPSRQIQVTRLEPQSN